MKYPPSSFIALVWLVSTTETNLVVPTEFVLQMATRPTIDVDNDDYSAIVDNTTPTEVVLDGNQVPIDVIDVDLSNDASTLVVDESIRARELIDVDVERTHVVDESIQARQVVNDDFDQILAKWKNRPLLTMPEVIDVDLKDSLLTNVYQFRGHEEFEARSNEARNVRKSIHNKFKNLPQKGYAEIDLLNLRPWYEDLRFNTMVIDYENANKQPTTRWHWRMIMIHPDATNVHSKECDVNVFTALLRQFYQTSFTEVESTLKMIDLAVDHDISFMVVVLKCGMNKIPQPFSTERLTSSNIVAAITLRSVVDPKNVDNISLYIEWLAVAKHSTDDKYANPPKPFTQWRQQGFALFLMKCVIKYAFIQHQKSQQTIQYRVAPSVEVYLQCHDVPSFMFYNKIGFTQLNDTYLDGFDLLPAYLQESILSPPATSRDLGDCLFSFAPTDDADDFPQHQLMFLRSGSLRWFRDSKRLSRTSTCASLFWCKYPPPSGSTQLEPLGYAKELLTQWFEDLPLLRQLVPPTYSDSPPLSRLLVKGEITFEGRQDHSTQAGSKWLTTGEIDLLLSTITWDGRYDDYCFIVSCSDMMYLQMAFKAYLDYTKAKQSYDDCMKEEGDLEAFMDTIFATYKKQYHVLADNYLRLRNVLMKKILKNAGLLSRRVIIFPINEDDQHWALTVVFNASYIDDVQSSDPAISRKSMRPCFFRYCSLSPSGRRETRISQGVAWYLNLCYSLTKHEKDHGIKSHQSFEMSHPYGNALDGWMLGTAAFPALYFDRDFARTQLPVQSDTYNCGIGVATCIAIVLRDVVIQDVRNDDPLITYDEMFNVMNLELKVNHDDVSSPTRKEHYCDFPGQDFVIKPLPWISTKKKDYLTKVREQWFRLIDKVAEHQYVIYPKAVLGNKEKYFVPNSYKNCKKKLIELQWPPERDDVDIKKPGPKRPPKIQEDNRVDKKQRTTKPVGNSTKKSGKRDSTATTTTRKRPSRNVKPKLQDQFEDERKPSAKSVTTSTTGVSSNVTPELHEQPEEDCKPKAKSKAGVPKKGVREMASETNKTRQVSLISPDEAYKLIDCDRVFGQKRMSKRAIFKPTMPLEDFFRYYRVMQSPPCYEATLETFVDWFKVLPLKKLLDERYVREYISGETFLEQGRSVMWDYRLFILDNGRIKEEMKFLDTPTKAGEENREWATKRVLHFYQKTFNIPKGTYFDNLNATVKSGRTIFITGTPLDSANTAPTTLIGNDNIQIIAAVTYHHGNVDDNEGHFARISLIAVTNANRCPQHICQWRHLRLGSFLLQLVIKLCVLVGVVRGNEANTALFTQCSDESTEEDRLFFKACGFQLLPEGRSGIPSSLQGENDQHGCTLELKHGEFVIRAPELSTGLNNKMDDSQIEKSHGNEPQRTKSPNAPGIHIKKGSVQTNDDASPGSKPMTIGEEIDAEFVTTEEKAKPMTIDEKIDSEFVNTKEKEKPNTIRNALSSAEFGNTEDEVMPVVVDTEIGKSGKLPDDATSVASEHFDATSIATEHDCDRKEAKESKWFMRTKNNIMEVNDKGTFIREVLSDECSYNDDGLLWKINDDEIGKRGVNIATRPIPFSGRLAKRVAMAEDPVEANAKMILDRIRAKDPTGAKELESENHMPKQGREGCTQSVTFCDLIEETYGTETPIPPVINMKTFNKEMERFIEASFVAWKWHTNKEHNDVVKMWSKRYSDKRFHQDSEKMKRRIQTMIKAIKDDRKKFREHFANEFKCSQQSLVKSVKFDEKRNCFIALLTWNEEVPVRPSVNDPIVKKKGIKYETLTRTDEIPIEKEWVKQQFGNNMYQYIVNMRQHPLRKWVTAPRDVQVYIGRHRIVRVRYTPPQIKNIVDITKLREMIESDDNSSVIESKQAKTIMSSPVMTLRTSRIVTSTEISLSSKIVRGRSRVQGTEKQCSPAAIVRNIVAAEDMIKDDTVKEADTHLEENEEIPRIPIKVPGNWSGKTSNGRNVQLTEDFVRASFGNAFANELKRIRRGFVDIPVGDFKSSRLHEHPELQVDNSPRLKFVQSEGKDLCVSKSLASAFFALGWQEMSEKIDAFGENILKGKVLLGLERVVEESKKIFPPWITVKRLVNGQEFNWKTDLLPNDVVIGVLRASDGNCSHAVTIYGGGLVFDANEPVALPLCKEALDYCTSTETVKTSFVCFQRAYRYRYMGRKPERIAKMTIRNGS